MLDRLGNSLRELILAQEPLVESAEESIRLDGLVAHAEQLSEVLADWPALPPAGASDVTKKSVDDLLKVAETAIGVLRDA